MEILERSTHRLILRSRPWDLWLTGILVLIVGSVPIWLTAKYELVCRHDPRPQDSRCRLARIGVSGVKVTHIPLTAIQNVHLAQEWRSSRGRRHRVYQVQLQTSGRTLPFGDFDRDEAQQRRMATQLSNFLQNPQQPPLTLVRDNRWLGWLALAGGWMGGLFVLLVGAKVAVLILDKEAGVISLQHSSLLTSTQQTFYWRDFADVSVQLSRSRRGTTARLALELRDGRVVPLRSYYTSDLKSSTATQGLIRAFRDNTHSY